MRYIHKIVEDSLMLFDYSEIEILMTTKLYDSVVDKDYEIIDNTRGLGYDERFMIVQGVKISRMYKTMGKSMIIKDL